MQPPDVGADLQVGPPAMLDVHDVHTYYGESHVLQGVTLSAQKGTVTAVLGRNGVGKTTLCRSLVGLTPARSGRIVVNGTDITRLPPHRIHQLGVSLVPQGRRIFSSLSVRENLQIAQARTPRTMASGGAGSSTAHDWNLDRVFSVFPRLADRRDNRGNELSGGEQQMLAIARALVAMPLLLIMDEPTEGLAPVIVAEVASVIRRLKEEGASILLAEQNSAFAIKVADYVHVMSKGHVVHSTDPVTLWNNEEIKTQFLGVPPALRTRRDL
jgi:branched-chain amino acid transport system ATP-binding protein